MALSTLVFEFNSTLIGQDAYNALVNTNEALRKTPRLGYNHEGRVDSVEFVDVDATRFTLEDFLKDFALEYRESLVGRFIPVMNALSQAVTLEVDSFGYIIREERLGWMND